MPHPALACALRAPRPVALLRPVLLWLCCAGAWAEPAAEPLRVVTDWCGDPARVQSYFVRFTKPVPVPDDDAGARVEFAGRVTAVADGVATIALEATCDGTKVLGAATCEVRVD